MFLEAIVKGIVYLIFFSFYLSFRYRETTYLYMIILYSVTLLTGLISSRSFLVEYLWALMHSLTSPANKDTLASSLPVCIYLISFSCFVTVTKTSNTKRVENFVLSLILLEMLQVSLHFDYVGY